MKGFSLPHVELGAEAEQLRDEVRAFLAAELEDGAFDPQVDGWNSGHSPSFSRKLGERGYLGMPWPRRYGGQDRSPLDRFVVVEELLAAGAPIAAHWPTERQVGPSLLRYGSEEQRQRFLPGIARGELYFAIGMSEPDVGSDLASVRTSAKRVGDRWIVNGTKIWTTAAHHCAFVLTLLRTSSGAEDRHDGLTQMIIDLQSPGLTLNPILVADGSHHFNEVVFTDVEVPDEMVLGEVGLGWQQVSGELSYERSGPERFLSTAPLLFQLVHDLQGHATDLHRAIVGSFVSEIFALRRMSLAVAAAMIRGEAPKVESSIVKELGTRLEQQLIESVRRIAGDDPGALSPRLRNLLAESVLHAPGFTLRGGSTEILKIVISRGLGL